jgi:predicted metal-dependent enzyme (double-stranded beta helix superfamily)
VFDVDAFIGECLEARQEAEPRRAIREVLERAVSSPDAVAAALPPDRAGIGRLFVSPELTILKVVWAPGMYLRPHDHRMWAAIGIYTGGEDNTFYRRDGRALIDSGGRELRPQDTCFLGDDAVHAVTNPTSQFAGAIHIYGGDFFTAPRSEWKGDPFEEQRFDVEKLLAYFEECNAKAEAGAGS